VERAGRDVYRQWKAPATYQTPGDVPITFKVNRVIEPALPGVFSPSSTVSVSATSNVSLHNSTKEIGDMSVQFLLDFSDSKLQPGYVVRDFWDGCPGKAAEYSDVADNRARFLILSYTISQPTSVTVNFSSRCAFRNRAGDGCASVPCVWHDKELATNLLGTTTGVDYLSAVYRSSRWWLCDSDFNGTQSHPGRPFIK
jgi:hypothetical protein